MTGTNYDSYIVPNQKPGYRNYECKSKRHIKISTKFADSSLNLDFICLKLEFECKIITPKLVIRIFSVCYAIGISK